MASGSLSKFRQVFQTKVYMEMAWSVWKVCSPFKMPVCEFSVIVSKLSKIATWQNIQTITNCLFMRRDKINETKWLLVLPKNLGRYFKKSLLGSLAKSLKNACSLWKSLHKLRRFPADWYAGKPYPLKNCYTPIPQAMCRHEGRNQINQDW